jgi:putative transposase
LADLGASSSPRARRRDGDWSRERNADGRSVAAAAVRDDTGSSCRASRSAHARRSPYFLRFRGERNRIWIWDATHFTRCKRVAYAIVDVVSRYWIGYLLSSEQTHTQVQLLFARALEDQGLLGADGLPADRDGQSPILVAWSDNGSEMKSIDTRQFMAVMAIAQHHGRPVTPTDQAHVESFFSHLKGDWPHLTTITDPAALDAELARIQREYNTVRLHAAIGYVTPDDEHHGHGPAIRRARIIGLKRAHAERVKQNRANKR